MCCAPHILQATLLTRVVMPDGALPEEEELDMAILLAFLLLVSYGTGNIHGSTTVNHGDNTDMLSLLVFKAATNDPTGVLRSWNRSVRHCDWTGVICSSPNSGRVVALRMPGQSLSGDAPKLPTARSSRT